MINCNCEDDAYDAVAYGTVYWKTIDPEHGIDAQVIKKAEEPEIKNDRLRGICKDLINQLEKEGFLSYGYLYKALGLKMPDESYRYKFWMGNPKLWKISILEEIDKTKVSLEGTRANAKGLAEQEKHYLELVQREISKADMLAKKIDILEGLLK